MCTNCLDFQCPALQPGNAGPAATADDKNILISAISAKSVTSLLFIQIYKSSNKYSSCVTPTPCNVML